MGAWRTCGIRSSSVRRQGLIENNVARPGSPSKERGGRLRSSQPSCLCLGMSLLVVSIWLGLSTAHSYLRLQGTDWVSGALEKHLPANSTLDLRNVASGGSHVRLREMEASNEAAEAKIAEAQARLNRNLKLAEEAEARLANVLERMSRARAQFEQLSEAAVLGDAGKNQSEGLELHRTAEGKANDAADDTVVQGDAAVKDTEVDAQTSTARGSHSGMSTGSDGEHSQDAEIKPVQETRTGDGELVREEGQANGQIVEEEREARETGRAEANSTIGGRSGALAVRGSDMEESQKGDEASTGSGNGGRSEAQHAVEGGDENATKGSISEHGLTLESKESRDESLEEDESDEEGNDVPEKFIYVYEVGKEYTEDLLHDKRLTWWSNQYDAEREIFRMLSESGIARTRHPEEASLFYVPFFSARQVLVEYVPLGGGGSSKPVMDLAVRATSRRWEALLRHVRSELPYFNRTNGQDHFSVLTFDHGRCSALLYSDPALYAQMFFLQLNGDQVVRSVHAPAHRHIQGINYNYGLKPIEDVPDIPCYIPNHDILLPVVPSNENFVKPSLDRPIKVLFRFGRGDFFGVSTPFANHHLRADLLDMFENSGLEGWSFAVKLETETADDWQRSLFCIAPPGHSQWTSRPVKSVVAGCIPVTFYRDHDQPWQDVLDHERFSINIDPDEFHTLPSRIDAVLNTPGRLEAMQRALADAQEYFSWNPAASKGALFQVVRSLRARARRLLNSFRAPSRPVHLPSLLLPRGCSDSCPSRAATSASVDCAIGRPCSRIRLCTGSAAAPFVSGTYISGPGGDGKGRTYSQLTVFEAELMHGEDALRVRFMAFLEDQESMDSTQWWQWGEAEQSRAVERHLFEVRCRVWAGHSPAAHSQAPLVDVPAVVENYLHDRKYHVSFYFDLPPEAHLDTLLYAGHFQVQLVASLEGASLLMDALPLCRSDRDAYSLPGVSRSSSTPPIPSSAWRRVAQAAEEGATGVAVCLRPYHETSPFSVDVRFSDARLLEFIDSHLLLGVDRIYVYDRYATRLLPVLQPYVSRGQVVHVPFPTWSEVFLRQSAFSQGKNTYAFPQIYDQIISYEHCMMQGRRYGDRWQFYTDSDEFLAYPIPHGALIKPLLDRAEVRHLAEKKQPLVGLTLKRFNFFGMNGANRLQPVVDLLTKRCNLPMWHQNQDFTGWHDKVAANPTLILPFQAIIHKHTLPDERAYDMPWSALHIKHYTAQAMDLDHHPCYPKNEFQEVEDTSMLWMSAKIADCRKQNCTRRLPAECWPFCRLPWPDPRDPEERADIQLPGLPDVFTEEQVASIL